MPLLHDKSEGSFKTNVKNLMSEVGSSPHVQSRSQALAIAYDIKRRGRAFGGKAHGMPKPAKIKGFQAAKSPLHTGPIISTVPGRTDKHDMSVRSGAYILPADVISHLGQNNTLAGMKIAHQMFGPQGPYGANTSGPYGSSISARIGRALGGLVARIGRAFGGFVGEDPPVDIVTAGGEYSIDPSVVRNIGEGDLTQGHERLDAWVKENRAEHIKTLQNLPGPAKK